MKVDIVFFNDTATTEIYTLSLHDALPIFAALQGPGVRQAPPLGRAASRLRRRHPRRALSAPASRAFADGPRPVRSRRSEEHTSELQSRQYIVCRLLLEKKRKL